MNDAKKSYAKLVMIWLAYAIYPFVFSFVAYTMYKNGEMTTPESFSFPEYVIQVAAVLLMLVSFVIKGVAIAFAKKVKDGDGYRKVMTYFTFRMSPLSFGIVMSFFYFVLTADFRNFLMLMALALIVTVTNFPTREKHDELLKELNK